uniref:Uncharacterized protein n=2 Tax=Meloidogyne TaxID=189290 RepID=A0A6V7W443_MELEN|nr:unnamed protein product [Meloidogyne enterolobii]
MKNSIKLKQKLPTELISELIQFIPFNIKWSKIRISRLFDIFVIKYQRKWILYLISLKAEVDKLFDNVLSPLKTFKSPKRSWGKIKLIESSSLFIGIFAMLQNFANIMPTFAADINDKFINVTWPQIDKIKDKLETMETNLMTRKKLLVDMLEFLQEKAKALENKKELSDLKLVLKLLRVAVDNSIK